MLTGAGTHMGLTPALVGQDIVLVLMDLPALVCQFTYWCVGVLYYCNVLIDVDECALGSDNMCAQNCQNTVGSYTCSCNTGYTLSSDGYTCDGEINSIV